MIEQYQHRAASFAAERDRHARVFVRIARLRLATVLPGLACLLWASTHGMPAGLVTLSLVLIGAFAVLVAWHARVEDRVAWFDALHRINLHAIARIRRDWDQLPAAEAVSPQADVLAGADATEPTNASPAIPPEADPLEHHPYANDLDLFGRASLVQWLGPAATAAGARTLREWLLAPATPAVVRARQLAVLDLGAAPDWREQFAAHGFMTGGVRRAELDRFLRWAEGTGAFTPRATRAIEATAVVLTVTIGVLIALHATGATGEAYWLLPILAGMVLTFAAGGRVHREFNRAGAGHQAFARLAHLFEHAVAAPGDAPYLQAVVATLRAQDSAAPQSLRRLNRILGFAQLRAGAGIFHFVVQSVTLWDFHVYFALDRWRRDVGSRVRGWMLALGELDALSAFARIKADNPGWAMPELDDRANTVDAQDLGHPLIPDDRRVGNDVQIGPPGTLLLITGSNMSGKSTLLRAVGLNVVLAQAGAAVCAASMRLPPVDLETSIRVQDSLEHGLSYFMAALERLKGVVDRAKSAADSGGPIVLYLLDEILQGTNTAERAIAVRGVARHLLRAGAIGAMTTHDLSLAGEEPLDVAARLAHFTEIVDERGAMAFDYRLRPGLATSRNALRLMKAIGLDLE